ncbi:hypothetical protein GGR51DRAFT_456415 [Nemania sp. FL0031]|nr:hypothetical protein GGR51DRAFT_456415 [Nemania sp. FL0031]
MVENRGVLYMPTVPQKCSRSNTGDYRLDLHTPAQTYHTHLDLQHQRSHHLVIMATSSASACAASRSPVNTMHMHTCGNCGTEYTTGSCWYCHPQNRPQIGIEASA